jgi:hypothetical protein
VRDHGGVVRTDHHNAGERSGSTHPAMRSEGSPCICCWWLVKPITGQAPSTAATLEWQRKAYTFNGIDRQSRAGVRVVFDVTRYLEQAGGHAYVLIWALYSVLEQ